MKQVYSQFLYILLSMLFLVTLWEFWLEDIAGELFFDGSEEEDFSSHVEYVVTVAVFSALSLLYPFIRAMRNEKVHQQMDQEREKLVGDLQSSLAEIKTLHGIIPICSYCKKIRNEQSNWTQLEAYIHEHSDASFSHGICPDCYDRVRSEMGSKKVGD